MVKVTKRNRREGQRKRVRQIDNEVKKRETGSERDRETVKEAE